MTPKMVSGSPRIPLLAVVIVALLMPVNGWAGEVQEYIYDDKLIGITRIFKFVDVSGDALLTCDEHMRNCTGPLMDGCYRQMQEAIRLLDDILNNRLVQTFSGVDAFDTIFRSVEDREQWSKTIVDCVK